MKIINAHICSKITNPNSRNVSTLMFIDLGCTKCSQYKILCQKLKNAKSNFSLFSLKKEEKKKKRVQTASEAAVWEHEATQFLKSYLPDLLFYWDPHFCWCQYWVWHGSSFKWVCNWPVPVRKGKFPDVYDKTHLYRQGNLILVWYQQLQGNLDINFQQTYSCHC